MSCVVEEKTAEQPDAHIVKQGYQRKPCQRVGVTALTARHFLHIEKQVRVCLLAVPAAASLVIGVVMKLAGGIIPLGVWGLDIFQHTFGTATTVTHKATYLNRPFLTTRH